MGPGAPKILSLSQWSGPDNMFRAGHLILSRSRKSSPFEIGAGGMGGRSRARAREHDAFYEGDENQTSSLSQMTIKREVHLCDVLLALALALGSPSRDFSVLASWVEFRRKGIGTRQQCYYGHARKDEG